MESNQLVFEDDEEDEDTLAHSTKPQVASEHHVAADGDASDDEEEEDSGSEAEDNVEEPEVEWACRYCGIADPASVVRCIESGSWFCNFSGKTSASHIVHHLVRAKNKEICLHPESPLGETIVECYNCGNRNVFTMGFIPAKGESMVVLLCRGCLTIGALKELGWNMESWTPLIKDRQLVSWLVKIPEEHEVAGARDVTTAEINNLEDMWKNNPVGDVDDLDQTADEVDPVELSYEDGYHFQNVFGPLVVLEAEYDRELKSQMKEENVNIRWRISDISGRITAVLMFRAALSEALRITVGDELQLTLSKYLIGDINANLNKESLISASMDDDKKKNKGKKNKKKKKQNEDKRKKDWECNGTVIHIDDDGEIHLELRSKENVPLHVESGYSVEFVWKPITFDRMRKALKTFAEDDNSVSGYLYHKLLGHEIDNQVLDVELPNRLSVKGLPDLNESQAEAIRQVLRKPLALIQGPPGTGKTVTSASLVYHMVKQNKGEQVLVTAPSNVAVDQLCEKLDQAGLKVVRIAAKSREHLESTVEHLSLHHIIVNLEGGPSAELKGLLTKKEESGNQLNSADMRRLMRLRKQLEQMVIKAADVICCTCAGAGDPRLAGCAFTRVLLDEATQATEPESLIPIVMGCKQFVLVGDHCQLGPVVMCKKAANAGLNSSLFERLVTLGLRPIRLTIQYRMHPCLSEFPSNTFYEGSLQNGVSAADRTKEKLDFPWPDPKRPMMFFSCTGAEELASTGTSYLNRTEAANCERVVTALLRAGIVPSQIGVVTPYEGQRAYVVAHMQRNGPLRQHLYREIEVSSVDAFQGREKDYIILSCVRSNEKQGIGFLNDPRRLNVALTRAKYGLVILGNPKVLAKRSLWNGLLCHFRDLDLLVEGSLQNLQVSQMRFPKAKKFYRDRRQRIFEESAARVFSGDVSDPFGERSKSKQSKPVDSRHDPRYGGASHARPAPAAPVYEISAASFLEGPTIPMPEIAYNNSYQQPKYKGYGDFDYIDYHLDEEPGSESTQQDMLPSQSIMTQPYTQPMASQSQFMYSSQAEQQTQSSQYQFQDEDDD